MLLPLWLVGKEIIRALPNNKSQTHEVCVIADNAQALSPVICSGVHVSLNRCDFEVFYSLRQCFKAYFKRPREESLRPTYANAM